MTDLDAAVPPTTPSTPVIAAPPPRVPALVDHARFAADFRRRAVTEARVLAAMQSLARRELRFGPYRAGPLASVEASGVLGTPRVRTTDAGAPSFAVTLPATLDLSVRLGALSRVRADVEIDLRLTPFPAADLFLYIDAAPVHGRDVRITLRGRGLGMAVSGIAGGLPNAVTDEIRNQVARQITNALRTPASRRGRTIDIAARIDGAVRTERRRIPTRLSPVSDEEFGRQFVTHAVSVARVSDGFASLSGQRLDIGPMKVGPGGVATVRGTGLVDAATVVRVDDAALGIDEVPTFAITLPLHLDLVVGLARAHRYHAEITAALRAVARPATDVRIVIDIPPVAREDITVTMQAADNLAAMLGRAGKIEDQIAAVVRRTVNDRIGSAPGRLVDVGAIVEGGKVGPTRPRPRPRRD